MGSSGGNSGPSARDIRRRERELDRQRKEQQQREERLHKQLLAASHVPQVPLPLPPEVPNIHIPAPEPPPPPATENKQEVAEKEQQEAKDAKRRRGIRSTILAGETGSGGSLKSSAGAGKKTLLG